MADDIIKVHHFAFEGYADFYLREDHFIYDDLKQPLNSKKHKYSDTALIHFKGEKDYYFFYREEEKYSVIFTMFQGSESFIEAIKDKVSSITQYQFEGFKRGKMILEEGKYFDRHSYQGLEYVDLFRGKKNIEKRFIYAPETDFAHHMNRIMIDKGVVDLNITELKAKITKGRKRSKRNRIIARIISLIILALILYLLIIAGYFEEDTTMFN